MRTPHRRARTGLASSPTSTGYAPRTDPKAPPRLYPARFSCLRRVRRPSLPAGAAPQAGNRFRPKNRSRRRYRTSHVPPPNRRGRMQPSEISARGTENNPSYPAAMPRISACRSAHRPSRHKNPDREPAGSRPSRNKPSTRQAIRSPGDGVRPKVRYRPQAGMPIWLTLRPVSVFRDVPR